MVYFQIRVDSRNFFEFIDFTKQMLFRCYIPTRATHFEETSVITRSKRSIDILVYSIRSGSNEAR